MWLRAAVAGHRPARRQKLWRIDMSRYVPVLVLALLAPAMAGPPPDDRYEPLEIKGWGTAINPDGDCKFSVERGRVTIAIPGKVHALSAELGRVNAPRLLQEVEGD